MKFSTFMLFALIAFARGDIVLKKRGVVADQQAYTAQAPASIAYTKVQQPVATRTLASSDAQQQYYAQQVAAAPATYSLATQQQLQYQPQAQAVAYAQPAITKYAAAPAASYAPAPAPVAKVAAGPVYRQPFSLANDVSSFTYSSPVVTYNNLGLLSQVVGKLANPPVQAKVAAAPAPAPAYYQAQAAPAAYSAPQISQARFALSAAQPAQRVIASAPQQYLAQAPQQAYAAAPQAQTYQATQSYGAQTVPQAYYSQAPQYFGVAQQVKQANPGVAYAQ